MVAHPTLILIGWGLMTFGMWATLHDLCSSDRRWVPLWLALAAVFPVTLALLARFG